MTRLLLVEDNELNRDMLSRRLQRAGFEVLTATDGVAALQIMEEQQPELVLMDMNLPRKDGWTACAEAKVTASLAAIPIIALTAHAMAADREKAFAAGCNDYATKPIDFPQLLLKIAALVTPP